MIQNAVRNREGNLTLDPEMAMEWSTGTFAATLLANEEFGYAASQAAKRAARKARRGS